MELAKRDPSAALGMTEFFTTSTKFPVISTEAARSAVERRDSLGGDEKVRLTPTKSCHLDKRGYEVFGTLGGYPDGHKKFFLRKKLCPTKRLSPRNSGGISPIIAST